MMRTFRKYFMYFIRMDINHYAFNKMKANTTEIFIFTIELSSGNKKKFNKIKGKKSIYIKI